MRYIIVYIYILSNEFQVMGFLSVFEIWTCINEEHPGLGVKLILMLSWLKRLRFDVVSTQCSQTAWKISSFSVENRSSWSRVSQSSGLTVSQTFKALKGLDVSSCRISKCSRALIWTLRAFYMDLHSLLPKDLSEWIENVVQASKVKFGGICSCKWYVCICFFVLYVHVSNFSYSCDVAQQVLMKLFGLFGSWPREEPINFGANMNPGTDTGICLMEKLGFWAVFHIFFCQFLQKW